MESMKIISYFFILSCLCDQLVLFGFGLSGSKQLVVASRAHALCFEES